MNNVEHLTTIYGDQRSVDDLSFDVHPGRLSRLVIGSVRSIIAEGCGLSTPACSQAERSSSSR